MQPARAAPRRQIAQYADQVAAHRAADAAAVHLDDLLVAVFDQQFVVDALLAEPGLDHRDRPAVGFARDAVEQHRLSAAKKAGEDGHGNRLPSIAPVA